MVVAVAGGTGGIGKTVVDQLKLSQKHEFVILSRKIPSEEHRDGLQFLKVDYSDVDSLSELFDTYNIDTVICTISLYDEASVQAQLNLIAAAQKSQKTRRFIPSEFGTLNTEGDAKSEPFAMRYATTAQVLKASGLKYSRFVNGFLLDYWGMPHIPSHMSPYLFAIDVAGRKAAIPGDGNDVISVALSVDVARFIVRSLDSQDWPEYSIVVGSDLTLIDALDKIQKVRGGKFEVTYDRKEDLENGECTILGDYHGSSHEETKAMNAMFGRMVITGLMHMPTEGRINDKYPEIRATTIDEVLEKAWAGKESL